MTGERAGGYLTLGGVTAMIFIVPFIYSVDIYDYTLLPKRAAFFLCVGLAALGLLVRSLSSEQGLIGNRASLTLGVFALLATLSLVSVTNMTVGVYELLFQLALLGMFLIGVLAPTRDTDYWITSLIIVGGVVSVIGILQYHNLAFLNIPSNGQPSSTFGYRNFAAMFLVAVIPASIFRFWRSEDRRSAIISMICGSLAVIYLLYTRTRGAWLGAAIGSAAAVSALLLSEVGRSALVSRIGSLGRLKPVLAGLAVLILVVVGPLSPRFTDTGLQRFDEKKTDIATTVTSVFAASGDRGRLTMWERTLPLVWDHLLLGVGPGHWEYAYPAYDDGAMIRPDSAPKRPHNDFVWIAAEYGIPALAAFIAFLAFVLTTAASSARHPDTDRRDLSLTAIAVIVGVSIHALFSFPKEQPQIAALFLLFAGIAVRGLQGRRLMLAPFAVLLLLVAALGSYMSLRHISFDRQFLRAMLAEDSGRWNEMKAFATEGLRHGDFRPHLLVIQGRANEKLGLMEEAEASYARALEIFPDSWHAHNGLGVVEKRRGNHQQAMVRYERALEIFPGAMSVRTNLGALYRAMGNEDRAEGQFRQVLRAQPHNLGANNNLGNIFRARGELDSAEVYYRRVLDRDPAFPQANQNMGDLLNARRKYAEAIGYYETALKANPNNTLTLWSLGSAQESMGRMVEAEENYRKAIEVDPRFPRPYFSLGTMLFGLHRWNESIDFFERFLAMWKGDRKFVEFAEGRIQASKDWIKRTKK